MSAASLRAPEGIWGRAAIAGVTRSLRMPQFLLPTVLTPAASCRLFTPAVARPASPAQAAVTGLALSGPGAGVAMEREQGLIELKRASPMPAGASVATRLVTSIVTTALALARPCR